MSVAAPPRPPHLDPEALIEEARRRARRRRLRLFVVGALASVLGVASIALGFVLSGSGPVAGGGRNPAGGARSADPILHAVYQDRVLGQPPPLRVDLASGRSVPLTSTDEIWLDTRTGLYRTRWRLGGTVLSNLVGMSCAAGMTAKLCHEFPRPFPFADAKRYPNAFDEGTVRIDGRGVVGGHRVIWVVPSPGAERTFKRAALDENTLELRAVQQIVRGRLLGRLDVMRLDRLPAGAVRFPVPKTWTPAKGAPILGFVSDLRPADLARARTTLDPRALWLGRRFGRLALYSVESGNVVLRGISSSAEPASVPEVRLVYGGDSHRPLELPRRALQLEEFNVRSSSLLRDYGFTGPSPGSLVLYPGQKSGLVRRGRVIVRITGPNGKVIREAARAFRPIPRHVPALTLHSTG